MILSQVAKLEGQGEAIDTPTDLTPANQPLENEEELEEEAEGVEGGEFQDPLGTGTNSFVTAVSHQRMYPSLPVDISHTIDSRRDAASNQPKRVTFASHVLKQEIHSGDSSSGESSLFVTGVAGRTSSSGDNASLSSSDFQTALQSSDKTSLSSAELARKPISLAKQQQPYCTISPTVPVNYALQQLSEGKKDPATIRKELAAMFSENVRPASQDQPSSSKQQLDTEAEGKGKGMRLGKRKGIPPNPVSTATKRLCPTSASSTSHGSGKPPGASVHVKASYSAHPPGRPHKKQQPDSWFSKLFRK